MKIIDLLNKIANGEEVPKYVHYYNMLKDKTDIMMVCKENIFYKLDQLEIQLNSRIEPVEEEKKIPEKLDHLIGYDIQQFDDLKEYVEITTNDLFGEVNKVIDTLNQLSDYLKSKGE